MRKKRKYLLITSHFYPETFRCNDIAFDLQKRGHQVTVLTGIPDYPLGKYYQGYSLFKKRVETINGVKVIRVAHIPRGNGSAIRMIIYYATLSFCFLLHGIYHALFHKYDAIFIHNISPAFLCLPAVLIKKIRGCKIDNWILDMWPESLAAGGIHNKHIYSVIESMMGMVYRNSDIIHISSKGFRKVLIEKGVPEEKIEYLPNFCEDTSNSELTNVPTLPSGFIVMFAGNLGEAQNMENIMKSALQLKDEKDIHFVLIGDGRKKLWIEEYVQENNLKETVHLLGRWPIGTMSSFFSKADVMLVSLTNEPIFSNTLPAKVQAYMVNKKPILAMQNGECQQIISEAQCGWFVDSDDIDGMVRTIKQIRLTTPEERAEKGANGYKYYLENFEQNKCIKKVEDSLLRLSDK